MFRIRSLIILFMLLSINCDLLNAQRNYHITIGNSASAYFLSAKNNWDATYIGLMMLPEITGSRSFDNDEKRVFISARWTGLESLIAKKNLSNSDIIPLNPASENEIAFAFGFSFKLNSPDQDLLDTVTIPLLHRFYIGIGYGNFKDKEKNFLSGAFILMGFEMQIISFNI